MRSCLVKCKNITKFLQYSLWIVFFIGITTLVKIPDTNRLYKLFLVLFILYGGFTVLKGQKIRCSLPVLCLICFSIISVFSVFWSSEIHIDTIIVVLLVTMVAGIFFGIMNTREKIEQVLWAVVIAVIAEFLYYIYKVGFGDALRSRAVLEGFNSNQVGIELVFASIICLYFRAESQRRLPLCIYGILFFFCLLTGSRTALILFVIGGIIFFFHLSIGKGKLRNRIIIGSILLIVVSLLLFKVDIFYNLIGRRISYEIIMPMLNSLVGEKSELAAYNNSNYLRWNMIKYGFEFFSQRPFLGAGINNYVVLIANTDLGYVSYAHNNYIELLTDVGMIGFCIYYFPYLLVGVKIFKQRCNGSPILRMSLSIWICLLLADMTGVNYYMMFQRIIFMLLLCIVYLRPEELQCKRGENISKRESV